jgi:hypothetical protein
VKCDETISQLSHQDGQYGMHDRSDHDEQERAAAVAICNN